MHAGGPETGMLFHLPLRRRAVFVGLPIMAIFVAAIGFWAKHPRPVARRLEAEKGGGFKWKPGTPRSTASTSIHSFRGAEEGGRPTEPIAMDLYRIILTKGDLAAMSQAERSLLLLLGHASNEINVLSKLILMVTRKGAPPSRIASNVEAGQVCVLLRILMGQLHEAWQLFRKRVQANRPLVDKYASLLDADGAAALRNLNEHFGGRSPLSKIRNKVAFHYSDDDNLTEQSFHAVAETESLELYLTPYVGNSFYHASELIVMLTAMRMAMSGDDAKAFSELCRIVIEVSRHITELFGQLMGVILKTYMPDLKRTIVNHPDGPKLSTLSLPYFIDFEGGGGREIRDRDREGVPPQP